MATLDPSLLHPIVADRIIFGEGTSLATWQAWCPLYDLPKLAIRNDFLPSKRVYIFAPHPDDEVLGCGGLMQVLAENGNEIVLVSVTNGTQSHPRSTQYSPEILNKIRPQETQQALQQLGIAHRVIQVFFDLPDGDVYGSQTNFLEKLTHLVTPNSVLVTVFKHDGHPDHEVTGQMVSEFAKIHTLPCYQVLIWAWHWASPADSRIDWQNLVRLDLTPTQQDKKRQALACFTSQILPDPSTGQAAVLPSYAIERILQIGEVFLKPNTY